VHALAWAVALSTTGPASASEEGSEQIVVVRLPSPSSRVDVQRERGDAVALLTIIRPPDGLVATLAGQTGRFLRDVSRRSFVGTSATVGLELSSPNVEVSVRIVEDTPAVILTFGLSRNELHPDHRSLFGAIPGVYEVTRIPFALPAEPGDAPCPGRIANERLAWSVPAEHVDDRFSLVETSHCAEYLASRLAVEAMNSGRSLQPFERWAYRFEPSRVWPDHRRSHALVALVVGSILVRTGYLPEAEIVLREPGLFRARSLRYYQALALAHLDLERARPSHVAEIVEPLLETDAPDRVKEAAGVILTLGFNRAGRVSRAIASAQAAWSSLDDPDGSHGRLAMLAGELSLAAGEIGGAKQWFQRAVDCGNGAPGRAGMLRLADFAARAGEFRRAKRLLARARPVTPCEEALVELRRDVMHLRQADAVLRHLEGILHEPTCVREAREARFALAQTYVQVGLPELAVPLAWTIRDELPVDYRHTREPLPLLRRAFRSAAARLDRHRRYQSLTTLYEEQVANRRALELLDGTTLIHVARAYIESGAPKTAASVLTTRLASGVSEESQRLISATLAEAYLQANDTYRADLVLDYFEREFGPEDAHVASLRRIELDLVAGRPEVALRRAESNKAPAGDPTFTRLELLGRARLRAGMPIRAAAAYIAALNLPNPAPLEEPAAVIRVLSACARRDHRGPCEQLYRRARASIPLGKRLGDHAQRLGWLEESGEAPGGDEPLAEMLINPDQEEDE